MKYLVTLLVVALAGCGGAEPKEPLLGKWRNNLGESLAFLEGGLLDAHLLFSQGGGPKVTNFGGNWERAGENVKVSVDIPIVGTRSLISTVGDTLRLEFSQGSESWFKLDNSACPELVGSWTQKAPDDPDGKSLHVMDFNSDLTHTRTAYWSRGDGSYVKEVKYEINWTCTEDHITVFEGESLEEVPYGSVDGVVWLEKESNKVVPFDESAIDFINY